MSNPPEIAVLPPATVLIAAGVAFLISLLASKFVADAKILPDHPNNRSSHLKVTSRAGGISIFIGWIAGLAAITVGADSAGAAFYFLALGVVGAVAFVLGLADDRFSLRPIMKLAGQVLAATVFVLFFGALEAFPLPGAGLQPLGIFAAPITVLWIVAFMNVFNFMDGVNGMAATCAVFVLSVFGIIAAASGALLLAAAAIVLAFSALGFLPANLVRGRLFMGDSGSHTISFLIAALAVLAANATEARMSVLFIPAAMAPFIFDVAITLLRRIRRKQNLLQAHREHFYQMLARSGASHGVITAFYLFAVVIASMAAAAIVRLPPADQWLGVAVLYGLLAMPAFLISRRASRAGVAHETSDAGPGAVKAASVQSEQVPDAAE